MDVIDVLDDAVCENIDCTVNGDAEDKAEEGDGQAQLESNDANSGNVGFVPDESVVINVVGVGVVVVLVDAAKVVNLSVVIDDEHAQEHLDIAVVVVGVHIVPLTKK